MSYISKLIERATDTSLDLENNQIGNYRITPQHGSNVAVYHIYKEGAKPSYSKRKCFGETHILTINISNDIRIEWNKDYMTAKERSEVIRTLKQIYSSFKVWVDTSYDDEQKLCLVCGSEKTRPDIDFPDTMMCCEKCGAEWNCKDEITFDSEDVD